MNWSRIAIAAVAAWIVSMLLGYLVNDVLFAALYADNTAVYLPRTQIQGALPYGFGAMLVGFLAFAYAYAKGYEGGNGVSEGARYGLLVGIMLVCFATVWSWVLTPLTGKMALAIAVDYAVEFLIYGAIVGLIYKPRQAAA